MAPNLKHLLSLIFFLCALRALRGEPVFADQPERVNGVSLAHLHRGGVGYGSEDCRKQLAAIKEIGGNWIAISEFAYMQTVTDPHIRFGGDRSMGNGDLAKCIADAHAASIKVMVKPHIWCREFAGLGKWHGDIKMGSEADWDSWFADYTAYILASAKLAESSKAEALCVGVEYQGTSVDQEARWRKVVAEVRKVYSGKLTYAAAFGEWPHMKWWDALDCIGVDAYFPVGSHENASEEEIRNGWKVVYGFLEPLSKKWNKPICFTELGYSQSSKAALEPWEYKVVNPTPELQARLYKVAVEEAAKRDYVVGMFVWKWFTSDQFRRYEHEDPFTMQDKPGVLEALKNGWKQ